MKLRERWETVFTAFISVILLLAFYFFIGGALCNDIKASYIEKKYTKTELPEKTERVETASWVGNSGNGNHTDIWAGMVVYSELPKEEIEEFFADYIVAELPVETDVEEYLAQEYDLELGTVTHEIEGLFSTLPELISEDGCYLISRYYEAFTQQDLRGH